MTEQSNKQPSGNKLFRFFVRLQNPLMKWLLRSPLHRFVSRIYMLITVTGRKSGRQYTTPVQYRLDNDTLFVITSRDYKWWRNLRGGAAVTLLLRGKTVMGQATIEMEAGAVERIAQLIYPNLKDAKLAKFLPNAVAVVIAIKGDE